LGIAAPNGSTIIWSIENDGYSIDPLTGAISKIEKSGKSTRAEAVDILDTVRIKGRFIYEDAVEEANRAIDNIFAESEKRRKLREEKEKLLLNDPTRK
jgi:hypothetical protein